MDRDALLEIGRRYKVVPAAPYRFHLTVPYEKRFVFRGPQWGHPSNYAAVRLQCSPASTLSLAFAAAWPAALSADECGRVEQAIAIGVVDGLLGATLEPLWTCQMTLVEVGSDEVMSSELAFYRATRGAVEGLLTKGAWELVRFDAPAGA